MKNIDKFHLS